MTLSSEIKWMAFAAALETNLDNLVKTFRGDKAGVTMSDAMEFIDKHFKESLGHGLEHHIRNNIKPDYKAANKMIVETQMGVIHSIKRNLEEHDEVLLDKDSVTQFTQAAVWMPIMLGVALDMCYVNYQHHGMIDVQIDSVIESGTEEVSEELDGLLGELGITKE